MIKPKLTQSSVVFSENPHGYRLGDRVLSGITSLIHDVLQLGVYPDANGFVRNFCIPRAGEYGTSVHHAIEAYDTLGIRVEEHPKSERYQQNPYDTIWNVATELDAYIRHREGYEPLANEYTVSDEVRYASNIDNIWIKAETDGIWLVDTKTNNLDLYPGGTSALQEYLSWQLSIYAYLFEQQNPGLKVEGLACNWLRKDDAAFWIIDRKADNLVSLLLSVEWEVVDGEFRYIFDDDIVRQLTADKSDAVVKATNQIVPQAVAQSIYDLLNGAKRIKEQSDKLTQALREAMQNADIKSWDSGLFKATIAADSITRTFDAKRFKADYPEVYEQYLKETPKKGGFTIKLRD